MSPLLEDDDMNQPDAEKAPNYVTCPFSQSETSSWFITLDHSLPARKQATGKSPEPAGWKACAT
jgi:hypothetical protein